MPGAAPPPQDGPFVYPQEYPLKVIGLAAEDFAAHALRLVERAAGAEAVAPPQVRESGKGKYHSVTVVIVLRSEAQRLAVYAALRADSRVVYAL